MPTAHVLSSAAVAMNLSWCIPGEVGGSEEYLVRQLVGLAAGTEVRPVVYAPDGFADAHPDVAADFPLVRVPVDARRRMRRIAAEHTWLAWRTRRADLVHHGGGTVPARLLPGRRPRTVLTIHDLQYLAYPQYLSSLKRRYLRWVMPRSAKRATVIAVPSEFVRSTVIDAYDVPPDRVFVVPHGVEAGIGNSSTGEAIVRARYGLGSGPVLVFPAMTHPHKGHTFLLRVMARHWHDPTLRLVLIGGRGSHEDTVMAEVERLGLTARVLRPGRVPTDDRNGLLRLATAMVFPSEYEGFGAPVIEAMALGVPVICSDATCLPDVVGDAAIVLPADVAAWAGALEQVVLRRDELVAAGHRRVERFTAVESARALLVAYGAALA